LGAMNRCLRSTDSGTSRREWRQPGCRRLRYETLEDRRLLAIVTVSNLSDDVNGNVASIPALIASNGGDGISLREAIVAANADAVADTINISVTGPIQLTNAGHDGEIAITNPLTINGPNTGTLTIRAFEGTAAPGDGARIFNIDDLNNAVVRTVSINRLTLTAGEPTGDGGAIRNVENLSVTQCVITDNETGGSGSGAT